MNNEEDEIIDLEEEETLANSTVPEQSIETPQINLPNLNNKKNNSFKQNNKKNQSLNKIDFLKNKSTDKNMSEKLKNLGNKNRSFPALGASNFNNETEKNSVVDKAKTKAASAAITAATGGAVHGKVADAAGKVASELSGKLVQKFRKRLIIISAIVIFVILTIFIVIFGGASDSSESNSEVNNYVTSSATEEDLIKQLIYYGYCSNEANCKLKSIYRFAKELKDTNENYQKDCPNTLTIDNPCNVQINTSLIIETINYYQNEGETFYTYDNEEAADADKQEGFSIKDFFSEIVQSFKKYQAIQTMSSDTKDLALAQTEYVKETCQYMSEDEKEQDLKDKKVDNKKDQHKQYFYQISFNKYVSYLKYGTSSTHPNYQGKPVEVTNEICQGPQNDYMTTSYDENNEGYTTDNNGTINSISGTGTGVDIVNYALQFVSNPYIWGGSSLTDGADCSGFTMSVMAHFGITLPHSAKEQSQGGTNLGTDISVAQPGDLITYGPTVEHNSWHVGIYIGNNKIVHASSPQSGIKISSNASYRSIKAIVRYWS